MIRGLFVVKGINTLDKGSGISKKINLQIEVLKKAGFYVDLYCINENTSIFKKTLKIIPILGSYQNEKILADVNILISKKKYNFVYFRKSTVDSLEADLLKLFKKHNLKTIYELPTYPFHNEYYGFKKLFIPFMTYYENQLYKYIDRIVTFSKDKYIWNVKTLCISNCIDSNEIKQKNIRNVSSNNINVIAVANFSFWHGYDRFIRGLAEYYQNQTNRMVKLYMVGDGPELKRYIELVKKYGIQKYVVFCGKLSGEELDNIYEKCDIALDALGRHRAKVYYNSSLKGKEYAAKGIPIVSGVRTEFDELKEFKYYLRVSPDDSDIKIENIINFHDNVYENLLENKNVISEIREICVNNFEYEVGYSPVINYINGE